MNCPVCGYQMSALDKDCVRCQNFAARGVTLPHPQAQAPSTPQPQAPAETPPLAAQAPTPAPLPAASPSVAPHLGSIVGMWLVLVVAVFGLMLLASIRADGLWFGFPLALELIALGLAVYLMQQRHPVDRVNGWLHGAIVIGAIALFFCLSLRERPEVSLPTGSSGQPSAPPPAGQDNVAGNR